MKKQNGRTLKAKHEHGRNGHGNGRKLADDAPIADVLRFATGTQRHRPANGRSPFPPISDYAFLSDGEVTALIAPGGNVEWMSVPRMDSAERLRIHARSRCG